jgi:hypothetical protein
LWLSDFGAKFDQESLPDIGGWGYWKSGTGTVYILAAGNF